MKEESATDDKNGEKTITHLNTVTHPDPDIFVLRPDLRQFKCPN